MDEETFCTLKINKKKTCQKTLKKEEDSEECELKNNKCYVLKTKKQTTKKQTTKKQTPEPSPAPKLSPAPLPTPSPVPSPKPTVLTPVSSPKPTPEPTIQFGNLHNAMEDEPDDFDNDEYEIKQSKKKRKEDVFEPPENPPLKVPENPFKNKWCPYNQEPNPITGRCVVLCDYGKVRSFTTGKCITKKTYEKELVKYNNEYLTQPNKPFEGALDCIERSALKLAKYQNEVVRHMENNRGLLVVHGTGSGKTLTAVTLSQCFLDKEPNGKVIVATPKSLLPNFIKEMSTYKNIKYDKNYHFFTHDGLVNFIRYQTYDDAKKFFKNSILLIDEIHNFRTLPLIHKKHKSRPYFVREAAKLVTKAVGFTATPFVNRMKDFNNLLSIVTGSDIDVDNLPKYKPLIHTYFRPKDDASYPSVNVETVKIPMTDEEFEAYLKQATILRSKMKSDGDMFWISLRQSVNFLDDSPKSKKALWVLDLVKNGKKSVIYSSFKDSGVFRLAELFDENNIKYDIINGTKSVLERKENVQKYNNGELQVLLITKAGGEGLDLKETRQIVFFDPVWNPASEEQIMGRGVRKNSHVALKPEERNVTVYKLMTTSPDGKKTADGVLYDIINRKKKESEKVYQTLTYE